MQPISSSRIWVLFDVMKGQQTSVLRGSISRDDFDRLLTGEFTDRFVRIEGTHWVDGTDEAPRLLIIGSRGLFENLSGIYYVRVSDIVAMGELKGPPAELADPETGFLVEKKKRSWFS